MIGQAIADRCRWQSGSRPIGAIAVMLMLTKPASQVNGPAFVLGWMIGLDIAGAISLAVAGTGGADTPLVTVRDPVTPGLMAH